MVKHSKISHSGAQKADFEKFLEDEEFSDVVFILDDEQRFHAHRPILAARSEYFRGMFQTEMRESSEKEIRLKETPAEAFKALLRYLYTGELDIAVLELNTVINLLELANKHLANALETAISKYLKNALNMNNIGIILKASFIHSIPSFLKKCLKFIDQNAPEFLKSTDFKSLSSDFLDSLLQRDSLDAAEEEIFDAVVQWIEANSGSKEEHKRILENLRLHQIAPGKLRAFAAKTGLLTEREIKKASPRCIAIKPIRNVATYENGTKVIAGTWLDGSIDSFLGGKTEIFTTSNRLCYHDISRPGASITIKLGRSYTIGSVRFLLYDLNSHYSYSYYVEASLNGTEWTRVADKTQEECKSWQDLKFTPRPLQFIKIVGTRCSINYVFRVFHFECPSKNQ